MDINYDELLLTIKKQFPPISFVFCYGSAAFPQAGYDYSLEKPMIDLIFVVEDYYHWHQENFIKNRNHYSGLGYLFGARFLSFFERNFIPVHYNPYVTLSKYEIKYGVVSMNEMIDNLNSWENLVIAGRMHKPIRILYNSSILYQNQLNEAIKNNYISALSLAILLNYDQFIPQNHLFHTIGSLSYMGDIRMILGLEKKDKIQGIVLKQEENFKKTYNEVLKKSSLCDIIKYNEKDKIYEIINIDENRGKFIENIPYSLGIRYSGVNKDFTEILKTKKNYEIQDHILKSLKMKNLNYSIRLIIYHFLTTSFITNVVYSLNKIKKRFK